MWKKGLTHYHTQFRYPQSSRLAPSELAGKLSNLGCCFCFCAGDHGDNGHGRNSWGFSPVEYNEYQNACFSAENSGAVLIPAPELHLRFKPFDIRSEHHACISLGKSSKINHDYFNNEPMDLFELEPFADAIHKNGETLILNHPFLSVKIPAFNAPEPLKESALFKMDYFELFTFDHPGHFNNDFQRYLAFLAHPDSFSMGCSGGVDTIDFPDMERTPVTYLFIEGETSKNSVLEALDKRKTYASNSKIKIDHISPVPSSEIIESSSFPQINFEASAEGGDKISTLEIYRNGLLLERIETTSNTSYALAWSDPDPLKGRNSYIIRISSLKGELATSPIHYICA
jgi:hypothetical protein